MAKTLILNIDRDDDFGRKAKVKSPIIGIESNVDAANRLGRVDPEDSDLNAILKKNLWIVEGVYYSWLMRSFQLSDRIIVLKTSTRLRAIRIIKRFIKRKTGLIKSKKESLSDLWQLLKWNHGFDRNNLKHALRIIADFQDKVIYYENLPQISKEIENGLVSPCRL